MRDLPSAVPLDLGVEIERADRSRIGVGTPILPWHEEHDLELVAVRIGAVHTLGRAMVALAGVRAGGQHRLTSVLEVADAVDLPGEVIEPDAAAGRPDRVWA